MSSASSRLMTPAFLTASGASTCAAGPASWQAIAMFLGMFLFFVGITFIFFGGNEPKKAA
jgi:energy-converting hydrogenase Eha subunit E